MKALSLIAVVFLFLASCATLTEEEQYARADKLTLAMEKYQRKVATCQAAGGAMMITFRGIKSKRGPTAFEYNSAQCVRW